MEALTSFCEGDFMKEIQVVGAAIRDGDRILAAQRSSSMKLPLKWEFVGGKIEKGETHQQALKREVMEELGAVIEVKDYIATGFSEMGETRITLHVYAAILLEGIPIAKEHAQLRWIEINKLNELDWAEADIPASENLIRLHNKKAISEQ